MTQTLTVPIVGDLSVEPNEVLYVNLTSPVNVTLSDAQSAGTIVDDDAVPNLTISDVSVTEGHAGTTTATFTLTLSSVSSRTITVDYGSANISARAGRDYTASSGTVAFAPGTTTQTIHVAVIGDQHIEDTEAFAVNLSNSWATVTDSQGVGTITTDDNFTDPTLTAQSAAIKAVHLAELRTQINLLRTAHGLGAFSWTGAVPVAGMTPILEHVTEARTALGQVYSQAAVTPPSYSVDPTLARFTVIKKDHVQEIRNAIKVAP